MRKLTSLMLTIIFVLLFGSISFSYTMNQDLDCLKCHTCENPTPEDLCLKACPSLKQPTAESSHSVKDAPDTFLIQEISDLYEPVNFNHKLHADMAQMGTSCATCHHYSPKDRIPPCKECHAVDKDPTNLRQPSLKGAYHRQCLSCHREWSHETECILCHLPSDKESFLQYEVDSTDIMGISHPVIQVPDRKVYKTSYEEGSIVTFYHQEHIDMFELRCVDCHKEENCSYCHDLNKETKPAKTEEEIHNICKDCHELCADCPKGNCMMCHSDQIKPGFSHDKNWKLSKYHEGLSCRNCHPTGQQITKMNAECTNCHSGWSFENFRHGIVGLEIDELHSEFECADCHIKLIYHNKPACETCHDDNRNYKKNPPGEYVK